MWTFYIGFIGSVNYHSNYHSELLLSKTQKYKWSYIASEEGPHSILGETCTDTYTYTNIGVFGKRIYNAKNVPSLLSATILAGNGIYHASNDS